MHQENNQGKKVIFIVITRGFIIRNILRSGGFDLMMKKGYRLIIFINCKKIPEYLKSEFENDNVILIPIKSFLTSKLHRVVNQITLFLIFSDSTDRYLRYGNKRMIARSRFKTLLHILFVRIMSAMKFLRSLMRWVEMKYFSKENIEIKKYFEEYNPDLIFSTSIISNDDIVFMKEAKNRGIKTLSMAKGWDNITRNYYRFIPDYMIVQNEILKDKTVKMQDMSPDRVFVVGFPQFDWYAREDIIRSREEHFKIMGLDPRLPVIFFGSEGNWADKDDNIVAIIYEWIKNNELSKECQLLVRPHFSNVKEGKYLIYKNKKLAVLDETFKISNNFNDNWDPTKREIIDFVNSLIYCDILITVASTLNLDAVCLDKPVINIGFGAKFRKTEDITPWLYRSNHMQWVLRTGGVDVVYSKKLLKEKINKTLIDSNIKRTERARLRKDLCYKIDGMSSFRMVNVIDDILENKI